MAMKETTDDTAIPQRPLRPVNLIPVGLKEAALDSPSFRASVSYASDQVDTVERWIETCIRATTKLVAEAGTLENLVTSFVSSSVPPQTISESALDHDYSLVAAKRFAEATKDSWLSNITELRKLDTNIVEPLRHFSRDELRTFRDCRKQLEQTQKTFDQLHTRYAGQTKSKEPSSLREDAFQLHEARKAYLKASLDFTIALPHMKLALDKVLSRVFADQTQSMRTSRDATSLVLAKYATEVGRIRSWSKELESGEKSFRKELQGTRAQIEEAAELAARPSRELEDYFASAASIKGPASNLQAKQSVTANGRQGWLNMKIVTGKQARTIWIRRWFFVKNGVFGWLVQGTRSGGIEESERIGVLLCGLRPATSEERRFCFEVKTKDITIVLQAESQADLTQWMLAFDSAKQKALEDPASTTTALVPSQPLDLAFAISPPASAEFTASALDVGLTSDDAHDRSVGGPLAVPGDPSTPTHRGSFDVTASRRSTGLDVEGGGGRTARKVSGTPRIGTGPDPSSGIAGLISVSNMTLPLGAGSGLPAMNTDGTRSFTAPIPPKVNISTMIRALPRSTLAPSTLVKLPVTTALSNSTIILSSEKGNASAQMDLMKGTPSGMMANSWGSLNWAYNNNIERSDLKTTKPAGADAVGTRAEFPEKNTTLNVARSQSIGATTPRGHRKTVSLDGDAADLQRTLISPGSFPNYYPMLLKHHDAQFRVLFPNVPKDEKLVMVFRAMWNPSDQGDFPGRVYVTARCLYFYSNHLGLILTSILSFTRVTEVTAAPGRECDYLFVHLKQSSDVDYTRITVKVFLEPLKLLQKRLNYLVENVSAEKQDDLESIMRTLLNLEKPSTSGERSPSVGSTDGFEIDRHVNGKDLRTRMRVDSDILGIRQDEKEKFKLPSRPVNYTPNGMTEPVVEMNFKISPKALFHVLFGDRSAIWQVLYHQRGALGIKQGPWTKPEAGHYRRIFDYRVPRGRTPGLSQDVEVSDSQTIDVLSEHLCYVVTTRHSAWYLPMSSRLELISKVVITHVARSNCKVAIYTAVNWEQQSFLRPLIDHQALVDLKLDALDLMDVVKEQVDRLGSQGQSKKATQIFGLIGQDTPTIEFQGADSTAVPRLRHMAQKRSLTRLFFSAWGAFIAACVNFVLAQIIAIFDWAVKTLDTNFWLLTGLALSLLVNGLYSSGVAFSVWQDFRAGQYMQSLGISKDLTMTRAISLTDIDLAITPVEKTSENICYQTFKQGISDTFPTRSSNTRLRKSQRLLGKYRHDLIVAMRVVNGMEQELIQAEWEFWLEDEAKRCATARKLLGSKKQKKNKGGTGASGSLNISSEAVDVLQGYCKSCEDSRDAIRKMGR